MKKCLSHGWYLWPIFLVACGSPGQDSEPADPASVQRGAQIYSQQCESCHGDSGQGSGAFPALTPEYCDVCDTPTQLSKVIAQTMPLGNDLCVGQCATDVAAYITDTFKPNQIGSDCQVQSAPIRRLTRFEYSNTLRDLLGDTSNPGVRLPSEELGNGFGNDANAMSVSSFLVEQYSKVAEDVASNTLADSQRRNLLGTCLNNLSSFNETSCAQSVIADLLSNAFRRPATGEEQQAYQNLYSQLRAEGDLDFALGGVIAAVLQAPEFLYRSELGQVDAATGRRKPSPHEMASRLSYFLWGTMPDAELLQAAQQGRLSSAADVRREAQRMVANPKSRAMLEYFFDSLLPISSLQDLERDPALFPNFSAEIGAAMRAEIHALIQHVMFEGAGDWQSVLRANYSFVNGPLASFYGIGGVSGEQFQLVYTNPDQRKGILTSAGVMAGTTHSVKTNPVARGAYIMKKMLCTEIPLPTGDIADLVVPPDPSSGLTARERFSQHASDAVCQDCHKLMDPVGLVFEQYDPVGLFRTHENGIQIDASGELPGANIPVNNAIELVDAIAADPRTYQCFAHNWANFAYGKTLGGQESCLKDEVARVFEQENYDIQNLLVNLTQTDAFLYLPDDAGVEL